MVGWMFYVLVGEYSTFMLVSIYYCLHLLFEVIQVVSRTAVTRAVTVVANILSSPTLVTRATDPICQS